MGKANTKITLTALSVIFIGFVVAMVANIYINEWAFIPLALVYWTSIFVIVKPTKKKLTLILSQNTRLKYILISLIPVLFGIASFAWGIQYINGFALILLWIIFAVFNPIAEELFWRSYLLDNLSWKPVAKILFSTGLFLLSHMMWGVFSITIRSHIMILPLIVMGLIWGYVYHKTKSLKWCIIAHCLVDILNLSVWVFLNIYIPPVIQ
ncbi:CPBP family intramembrane glutamic endopeptidase [Scatolibacter rhodanostii]|uniref:CPBP family intramembrane glutamic endopeptidase n=1 Tax=Scatolibacter rhodanostii TaxID=2014781 RepID=UPI000C07B4DB|nr:CPBP family intramembrane glutamic endopeptidase [Scatolibacter rhodanostii]